MITSQTLVRMARRAVVGVLAVTAATAVVTTPGAATPNAPNDTAVTAPSQDEHRCRRIDFNEDDGSLYAVGCRPPLEYWGESATIHGPRRTFYCEEVYPGDNEGDIDGRRCHQID
jgi:hypothetical protein